MLQCWWRCIGFIRTEWAALSQFKIEFRVLTTFQNARRRYACQAYGSAQVF
jgi:hypothetical protein